MPRYGDMIENLLKKQDEQFDELKKAARIATAYNPIWQTAEARDLVRELNALGLRDEVYQSWMKTGSGKIRASSIIIGAGGDIQLNEFGLFFANQEGLLGFQDTNGSYESITVYSDGDNFLVIANAFGGKGVSFLIDSATHEVMQFDFNENSALAGQAQFQIFEASKGAQIYLGDDVFIESQGVSGGVNAISLRETTNTPADPEQDGEGRIYFRGNKIVFQWNDGGTTRYKYLDLTGVGVTWVHSTSAP